MFWVVNTLLPNKGCKEMYPLQRTLLGSAASIAALFASSALAQLGSRLSPGFPEDSSVPRDAELT